MDFTVDLMQKEDWLQVQAIHAEGLATGLAAFRNDPPTWEEWDADYLPHCRLVAKRDSKLLGWAALTPVANN